MTPPKVALLTLNWNAGRRTTRWIEAVGLLDYPLDRLQVIIRDNASSDDSVEVISEALRRRRDELPRIEFVAANTHPGVTSAWNELLEKVDPDCEVVVRVDNDVELAPDCLGLLVGALAAPHVGIAGPKVMYAADRTRLNCGAVFLSWSGSPNRIVDAESQVECDVILGCVMAFRRDLLRSLAYWFRRDFYFFAEEPDVCFRARRAGYATLYVPSAVAYHDTKVTSDKHPWLSAYLNIRNHVRFHAEFGTATSYVRYLARLLAGVLKRSVARRDAAEIRGFVAGVLDKPVSQALWERGIRDSRRPRPWTP